MTKKQTKNNLGIGLVCGVIVLLGGTIILIENANKIKDKVSNKTELSHQEETTNKDELNTNDEVSTNTDNFDEQQEKAEFTTILNDYKGPFSNTLVKVMIEEYATNQTYSIPKNQNLISSPSNKQFFILEYLLETQKEKFIVLNGFNNEVTKELQPTDDGTLSYFPTKEFQTAYKQLFGQEMDVSKREKSASNTKYDNDSNYIYYNNKRIGTNGMSATIKLDKITYNNNLYQASVTINYSTRMQENLQVASNKATLTYQKVNNSFYLKEFTLNK